MKLNKNELIILLEGIDALWNCDSSVFEDYGIGFKDLYHKLIKEVDSMEKPQCYTPNNDTYPLCKGKSTLSDECKNCCLFENMTEEVDA